MCTTNGCASSTSKNDNVCEVNDKLQNICTNNENNLLSVCANCHKEGSDDNMNTCNKCNMVKYCNAACKKKHRSKHKKQCERRVVELHDEKLFKQPPPANDCPICFLIIPTLDTGKRYQPCCGKMICSGCFYAPVYDCQGKELNDDLCPFCRAPHQCEHEENVRRLQNRIEHGDARAIHNLGCDYAYGTNGLQQDNDKALKLYHQAGELGYATSYYIIGLAYANGQGLERDKKKGTHYIELAAMMGNVNARYNLGQAEENAGNVERGLKHYMIAAVGGDAVSLKKIKELYSKEYTTKEYYTKALQSYQTYLGEIKSAQRDKAAAAQEDCIYY